MYILPKAQSLALALLSAQATEVSRRPAASPPRQSSACRRNVFRMSMDVGCGMWDAQGFRVIQWDLNGIYPLVK